jgi:hypothetical protein
MFIQMKKSLAALGVGLSAYASAQAARRNVLTLPRLPTSQAAMERPTTQQSFRTR